MANSYPMGSNYTYCPIVVQFVPYEIRDLLHAWLRNHGILSRRYFYPLLNGDPGTSLGVDTPNALELSRRVLCLPLFANLHNRQVGRIAGLVNDFLDIEADQ
jgi:dTDP-4-amino-4,6-dideoxygalactose transaminase